MTLTLGFTIRKKNLSSSPVTSQPEAVQASSTRLVRVTFTNSSSPGVVAAATALGQLRRFAISRAVLPMARQLASFFPIYRS